MRLEIKVPGNLQAPANGSPGNILEHGEGKQTGRTWGLHLGPSMIPNVVVACGLLITLKDNAPSLQILPHSSKKTLETQDIQRASIGRGASLSIDMGKCWEGHQSARGMLCTLYCTQMVPLLLKIIQMVLFLPPGCHGELPGNSNCRFRVLPIGRAAPHHPEQHRTHPHL